MDRTAIAFSAFAVSGSGVVPAGLSLYSLPQSNVAPISDTCVGFSTLPSNFQTPTGYPSSDAVYLERESDSTG